MSLWKKIPCLCLTFVMLTPAEGGVQIEPDAHTDFSLHAQYRKTDFLTPAGREETRLSTLGTVWMERLLPRVYGSLQFGYLEVSQPNNPIPAARVTEGGYAGIGLHGILYQGDRLNIDMTVDYRYHQADSNQDGQDIEHTWRQAGLGLQGSYQLIEPLSVSLRVTYHALSGEQRASGNLNQTLTFEEDTSTGYAMGLDLRVERGGHLGLEVYGGNFRGVGLYFRRWF